MKILRRILAGEFAALRSELELEFEARSQVIFHSAYCQGQLYGQQTMIDKLQSIVAERHQIEAAEEDIERLKKGAVH